MSPPGSTPKATAAEEESLPARHSLVQEVAEWLRQRIRSGAFDGPLPSHRALRTHLQVGRSTIQAAFTQLHREGIIELQPRKRAVPKRPGPPTGRNKIGWLQWDIDHNLSSCRRQELLFFQTMIQQRGFDFELFINNLMSKRHRVRNRIPLLDRPNVHCWLLFNQPPEVQLEMAQRGLQAIVVGARAPGVDLPWIDLNIRGAARHAAGSALAKGHRRVAFFCSKASTTDHDEAVEGLRDVFKTHEHEAAASLTILRHDETRHGILRVLRQLWLKEEARPTIVIVKEAYAAMILYSTLLSQYRVRLPHDLSLVCLEPEHAFTRLNPTISAYGLGPQVLWRQLTFAVTRIARLNGTWHYSAVPHPLEGETFAPPPVDS